MSRPDTAGVILAGGRSSRMGRDKAALPYRGQTLLDHMADLLQAAGLDDIHISGPGHIADLLPGLGPLGGVHAAVHSLRDRYSRLLFVPVDMPGLPPMLLARLVAEAAGNGVTRPGTSAFPFVLSQPLRALPVLEKLLADGTDLSLKGFHRLVGCTALEIKDATEDALVNINTPEDWRSLAGKAL